MRRISYFIFLAALFLSSCTSTSSRPLQTVLLAYRFAPPAFLEFSNDLQLIKEIPYSIPPNCGLNNTFPAPLGSFLLIELNCPNGQSVLFLDVESASVSQPVTDTDSHFLAWTPDGKAAYLKVDSLGNTRILRVNTDGASRQIPITGLTYDLSTQPDSGAFTFTFSRGLGQGSELWLAQRDGKETQQLYSDAYNYISFARYSPDGEQIAFIKTPDTQTPFTVGELWSIPSTTYFVNGTSSAAQRGRLLANVDAGHGFAANWSPDGSKIAFVVRENPNDEQADQSSEALISNIHVMDVGSGNSTQITQLTTGYVETPFWSPDGNTLAFTVVLNGRMNVQIADMRSGEIKPFVTESTCCPAWMRK